jgi:hypothetical protein
MDEIPGVPPGAHYERQKGKLTPNSSSTQRWTFTEPPAGNERAGKESATTRELPHFRTLGRLPGLISANSFSWLQLQGRRAGTLVANRRLAGSHQTHDSRELIGCLQAVTLLGLHRRELNHSRLSPMLGMLTIDSRDLDLYTMNWGRRGALLRRQGSCDLVSG